MILTKQFLERSTSVLSSRANFSDQRSVRSQVIRENNEQLKLKTPFDIFLSHSSMGESYILALVLLFNDAGYSAYVDWLFDSELDRSNVTATTAKVLKKRMNESRGLAYVATSAAAQSKWCPWELGYFDAKSAGRCSILPVLNQNEIDFYGQEYLGLFPYLQYDEGSDNKMDFWVHEPRTRKYIMLSEWLNGNDPKLHI
ncbi:hypothetical protein [Macellibacteroides fermentans]|uniref:hypothetical protein n=1 Tax=Macellibacteroides fermentans TaxID=879969 RepID=UPI00406D1DEF